MSKFIYTGDVSSLSDSPFWSLLLDTAQIEPVTIITQYRHQALFIQSLLSQANQSLSRFYISPLTDYLYHHTSHVRHDIPGLLPVIIRDSLQTLPDHLKQSHYVHTHGFLKEVISLMYQLQQANVSQKTLASSLSSHFRELSQVLTHVLDQTYAQLQAICPTHPLLPPQLPPTSMTSLFIIGFLMPSPYQRHILSQLIQHTHTLSWYLPYTGTTRDHYTHTLHYAQSIDKTFHEIPAPDKNTPQPSHSLYTSTSPDIACEWVIHQISDHLSSPNAPSPHQFAIVIPSHSPYEKALQLLASTHAIPLQPPQQKTLSHYKLFQSIDAIVRMLINGIDFKSVLTTFMSPSIKKIRHKKPTLEPSPSLPVSLSVLEWIGSEIDQNLETDQWVDEIKSLHHFLSKYRHKTNKILAPSTTHILLEVSQLLSQISIFKSLSKEASELSTPNALLSFFKTIDYCFHLCPDTLSSPHTTIDVTLRLRHYHTFWDALHIYMTHFPSLSVPCTLQQFWHSFSLFASYRFVVTRETSPTGVAQYRPGDWVPNYYQQIYVLGVSSNHWPGTAKEASIIPKHIRTQLRLTPHAQHLTESALSFSHLQSLPQCIWIHSLTESLSPQLPSPLTHAWTHSPLPASQTEAAFPTKAHQSDTHITCKGVQSHIADTLSQASFSATSLQQYQNCPHQFFLERILKIPAYTQHDDTVKATLWGQLIHQLLQQFFTQCQDNPSHYTLETLTEIAPSLFKHYQRPTFFWTLKRHLLFGIPDQNRPGLLRMLWHHLQASPLPQSPTAFETPFTITLSAHDTIHLSITGVIDLLLSSSDTSWQTVVDYKTSKRLPSPKDIERFRNIQLPIYLLAVKKNHPSHHVAGGILFQIRDENTIQQHVLCCDPDAKKDLYDLGKKRPFTWTDHYFSSFETYLLTLKQSIDQLQFSPSDFPNADLTNKKRLSSTCAYCQYHLVCRHEGRLS